jgi:LytS/YehU family sensor histidine kinase
MAALTQHAEIGIGFVLYVFFDLLMLGGAAVWVMNDRRRAQRERDRMHAAELGRVAAAKRSVESDLQAMQARVEPQFLFNTLAQVKRLYEQSAARGEQMLDELIAYLRAAMPKMRDTSSTVGQEMELVRAYLGIVRLRLGERLAFAIEPLEASVAAARLPPMMLLPLVDHAIMHGLEPSNVAGTIDVRAEAVDGRLRLRIADSGAGFVPQENGEGIDDIRERLQALFGSDGRLDLRPRERGATEALLDIPLEAVGGSAVDSAVATPVAEADFGQRAKGKDRP